MIIDTAAAADADDKVTHLLNPFKPNYSEIVLCRSKPDSVAQKIRCLMKKMRNGAQADAHEYTQLTKSTVLSCRAPVLLSFASLLCLGTE